MKCVFRSLQSRAAAVANIPLESEPCLPCRSLLSSEIKCIFLKRTPTEPNVTSPADYNSTAWAAQTCLCRPPSSFLHPAGLSDCLFVHPGPLPVHPHLHQPIGDEPQVSSRTRADRAYRRCGFDRRDSRSRRELLESVISSTPDWPSSLFRTNDCISPRTLTTSGAIRPTLADSNSFSVFFRGRPWRGEVARGCSGEAHWWWVCVCVGPPFSSAQSWLKLVMHEISWSDFCWILAALWRRWNLF